MNSVTRSGLTAALLTSSLANAAPDMQPGQWEVQTQTDIPGMPAGMGLPVMTVKHCFSAEDIKQNQAIQPDQGDCKVTRLQQTGSQLAWTMQCAGQQPMTVDGNGTFGGDHYEMQTRITMQQGPMGGQRMTVNTKARRLGDCP
jgi:hypothetical protein